MLKLEEDSRNNNGGRLYNYFLAYLKLCSNLCFERNYKGISALEEEFPFNITFGLAKCAEIPFDMRSGFVDLILYLHIDKDPREPLQIPRLTRIWGEFDESPECDDMVINSTVRLDPTLSELKDFVKNYLNQQ